MKKQVWTVSLLVLASALGWGIYLAMRAHGNLVTLDVRNMDVREVVKKIERQTRETILVNSELQGKLTLNVRKVPLEDVLNIIDDQISSRWSVIYPLYSTDKSLLTLKKALRGELDAAANGWTNLQNRSFFRGGFGGPGGPGGPGGFGGGGNFGDTLRNQNQMVSLQFQGKDVQFATLALGRYAQARVVPEDGTSAIVSLKLNQATISDAVAQLARQARRKWTKLYVLQGGFGGRGGPGEMAGRDRNREGGDRGDRRGSDWANLTDEQREELRKERETQREALQEQLKDALPPEERQKLDQAQQQREQQRQEFEKMTPEQRRERFAQMGGGNREQRQLSRIKNTTPEQKVERYRQFEERRQRWQQQGQPPRSR